MSFAILLTNQSPLLVADFILLAGLNKNNTRGMGSGTGVDSMVLLQSRAEKQFLGKAVHKTVMKGKKENEKMKWSKVLEVRGGVKGAKRSEATSRGRETNRATSRGFV